jgi:hypothetical protein
MDYDPARDYQTGEARARAGEQQTTEEQRELPAAISATDAKTLVQQILAIAWATRDKLRLRLPPRYLSLEPGNLLELALNPYLWSVESCTIDGLAVIAELRPSWNPSPVVFADSGRIVPNGDQVAGPISIALLDVPALSPNSPTVLLAASSTTPGWKRSPVDLSVVGQGIVVRTAPRKSFLGSAATILTAADPTVVDTTNSVEVLLIDADQWLTSCDDDAMLAGANLALIGGELIQFADVTPLGGGRFRLARLMRGRVGTESAISEHAIDEAFCVIEAGSLQSVPRPITSIGTQVSARVVGGGSSSLTVKPRAEAIASPSGGTMVDAQARSTIDQILATLRQHRLIDT